MFVFLQNSLFGLVISALMAFSIVIIFAHHDKLKKILALSVLQSSLIVLFVAVGYINNSIPPIIQHNQNQLQYSDPVPSVLMLTAIVVSFCISCLGYMFVLRLKD